jgi:hypothetical protein
VPGVGKLLAALTPTVLDAVAGLVAGAAVLVAVTGVGKLFKRKD